MEEIVVQQEVEPRLPELPSDLWLHVMSFLNREEAMNLAVAFDHSRIRAAALLTIFDVDQERNEPESVAMMREYCHGLVWGSPEDYCPIFEYILKKLDVSIVDSALIADSENIDPILRGRLNYLITERLNVHHRSSGVEQIKFLLDVHAGSADNPNDLVITVSNFNRCYQALIRDIAFVATPASYISANEIERAETRRICKKACGVVFQIFLIIFAVTGLITGGTAAVWTWRNYGGNGWKQLGKAITAVGLICLATELVIIANMCSQDRLRMRAVRSAKKCFSHFFRSTPTVEDTMERGERDERNERNERDEEEQTFLLKEKEEDDEFDLSSDGEDGFPKQRCASP